MIPAAGLAPAATRPKYGGAFRVEMRAAVEGADPPQPGDTGPGRRMAELAGPFRVVLWESGHRAVFAADDAYPGGRPFLDRVEVEMGRASRDQYLDLEVGKADMVEAAGPELRRGPAARRIWSSAPVRLVALVFNAAKPVEASVREALALAIDRAAIYNVLLQRQGEISGALLPQWVSGYAFLFPATADASRARALASGLPPAARALSLSYDASGPQNRSIAERIVLNARDAGMNVQVAVQNAHADVRLAAADVRSAEPAAALAQIAAALGLPEPARAESPEDLYNAERSLLDGYRVVPLFYLPETWAVAPRVKTWLGPGVDRLGGWRLEDVWLQTGKP